MKEVTKEQITFVKSNLMLMLKAKSVDEVVGMAHVLLNYVEHIVPEDIELWLVEPNTVQNKIAVIKELRGALGIGLKEAKDLSESTLNPIYRGDNIQLALLLHQAISKYARIDIRGASPGMKVLFGGSK